MKGMDKDPNAVVSCFGRLIGFGFIYAWGVCMWDMGALDISGRGAPLNESAVWFASAAVTPFACLVFALWGNGRSGAFKTSRIAVIASICALVGTVLTAVSPSMPSSVRFAAQLVAAVSTGAGPVVLAVLWMVQLSRVDAAVVEEAMPLSFLVLLVCEAVVPSLGFATAVVITASMPCVSCLLLRSVRSAIDDGLIPLAEQPFASDSRGHSHEKILPTFVAAFFLYALSCPLPFLTEAGEAAGTSWLSLAGNALAVVLAVCIVRYSRRVDLYAVCRAVAVPFVLSVFLVCYGNEGFHNASRVLSSMVFPGIEIITGLYFVRLLQIGGKTASTVFVGFSFVYAGILSGYMLGFAMVDESCFGAIDMASRCLPLLGAFALVMAFIPKRDRRWTVSIEAFSPGFVGEMPQRQVEGAQLDEKACKDVFAERCRAIAEGASLSKRETEIFGLLACGRSRPYIRDALFLSKNTVATHIKHIYIQSWTFIPSKSSSIWCKEDSRRPMHEKAHQGHSSFLSWPPRLFLRKGAFFHQPEWACFVRQASNRYEKWRWPAPTPFGRTHFLSYKPAFHRMGSR